jgi:capsular polysaccharide export protein
VVCDSGVPHDGGPAHRSMKDWINHSIRTVAGSDTLLLIKPHPHELNNEIATFPTEYFRDLIEEPLGENVLFLGHRWFDMDDMRQRMDLGLVYNGTTTIELGLMGIPAVLTGNFAPVDYPIGHVVPKDRADYEAYLLFEKPAVVARDIRERAAVWLDYMANEAFTQSYRFHARPVTNKVLYPPYWFAEDVGQAAPDVAPEVQELAGRALGERLEPGGDAALRHMLARAQACPEIIEPLRIAQASRRQAQDILRRRAETPCGRKAS